MGSRGCAYPEPGAHVPPSVQQDGALEFLAFISSQSGSTQLFLPGLSSRMQATPPVAGILKPGEWTRGSLLHRSEGEVDRGRVHMYFHSHAHRDPLALDEAGGGEERGSPGTSIYPPVLLGACQRWG